MAERESPYLWSVTALTNGSIDPSVNFAENQLPGTVNNSARAVMAGVARWIKDNNGSLTTGGTATAYTLTINGTQTAYATGHMIAFKASVTNTGAATLNVTNADGAALGPKALRAVTTAGDSALVANQLMVNGQYRAVYDAAANSAAGAWIVLNPVDSVTVNGLGGPLNINGNMEIDQPNAGAAITITGTGAVVHEHLIDSWRIGHKGSFVLNFQRVTDAPNGYRNSLKMTVATIDAAMASDDIVFLHTPVEGIRVARLKWGTADAMPLWAVFQAKAHRTGMYSGTIKNQPNDAGYPFSFTMSAVDTWEYKTVQVPGETAHTWPTGEVSSLYFGVCVAAGSSFLSTANAWTNGFDGVTGTTNGVAATSDVFQITGVALMPGTTPPSQADAALAMRSYEQERLLAQRYYYQTTGVTNSEPSMYGYNGVGQLDSLSIRFHVPMRIAPTITTSGTWVVSNCAQPTVYPTGTNSYLVTTAVTALGAYSMEPNNSGVVKFDARLG